MRYSQWRYLLNVYFKISDRISYLVSICNFFEGWLIRTISCVPFSMICFWPVTLGWGIRLGKGLQYALFLMNYFQYARFIVHFTSSEFMQMSLLVKQLQFHWDQAYIFVLFIYYYCTLLAEKVFISIIKNLWFFYSFLY